MNTASLLEIQLPEMLTKRNTYVSPVRVRIKKQPTRKSYIGAAMVYYEQEEIKSNLLETVFSKIKTNASLIIRISILALYLVLLISVEKCVKSFKQLFTTRENGELPILYLALVLTYLFSVAIK